MKLKSIISVLILTVLMFSLCGCDMFEGLLDADSDNLNLSNQTDPIKSESQNLISHHIDVGQSDSEFIELPNGQTMLIDAGVSEYGDKIVNYIKDLGYSKIDYVIGTHPHADHIGGMQKVVESFDIENIYMPKASTNTKTYEKLLTAIQDKGLKIKTAKAGVTILEDKNLTIYMLAPNNDKYSNLNNYSAVVKITYKNKNFLYMGDAEELSENEILGDVSADVIKVGHHGSNSSSSEDFVNRVNAKYAIISVGTDNKYKHPNEEIIQRWQDSGTAVYRTDLSGTAVVTSDGNSIDITTEREA